MLSNSYVKNKPVIARQLLADILSDMKSYNIIAEDKIVSNDEVKNIIVIDYFFHYFNKAGKLYENIIKARLELNKEEKNTVFFELDKSMFNKMESFDRLQLKDINYILAQNFFST